MKKKRRCHWGDLNPYFIDYHDKEWGVPITNDQLLFEFLVLEGMQAGLSWITILKKRPAFRLAFANFNAAKIAKYDKHQVGLLLANNNIIRNKLKIESAIQNARAFLQIKKDGTTFAKYIWHFVEGSPIQNRWRHKKQIPDKTAISIAMSKALKKKGFKFVGPTICYAFMQAVGMVNDHTTDCFRHKVVAKILPKF